MNEDERNIRKTTKSGGVGKDILRGNEKKPRDEKSANGSYRFKDAAQERLFSAYQSLDRFSAEASAYRERDSAAQGVANREENKRFRESEKTAGERVEKSAA